MIRTKEEWTKEAIISEIKKRCEEDDLVYDPKFEEMEKEEMLNAFFLQTEDELFYYIVNHRLEEIANYANKQNINWKEAIVELDRLWQEAKEFLQEKVKHKTEAINFDNVNWGGEQRTVFEVVVEDKWGNSSTYVYDQYYIDNPYLRWNLDCWRCDKVEHTNYLIYCDRNTSNNLIDLNKETLAQYLARNAIFIHLGNLEKELKTSDEEEIFKTLCVLLDWKPSYSLQEKMNGIANAIVYEMTSRTSCVELYCVEEYIVEEIMQEKNMNDREV